MSKFLTSLVMQNATDQDDGKWRLTQPLVYDSDVAGRVFVVPVGFVTDLASVPRVPIAYLLAGGTSAEASVVHDAIYTYHWVSREIADAVLREASAVTQVPWLRRQIMWLAVRCFGGSHWDAPMISEKSV
ncbi:hypothetical protein BGLT_02282 [Caballeronia glathei]|uniref:DUF1353 domain-containing protein n=1 Tax=Caballeronia glathei TaxID=60547 RepID=A0A069PVZ7_9BURK|nr:DUF1353 domain-containing protein [Caballeronia glathei]KDR41531.1 hypothetical protein BG61_16615 [Caballeronia glathei]CDY79501.1 hypothetical protein BGLT_02282 [Caballeronia glathei]